MAKGKGKKFKSKGQNIGRPDANRKIKKKVPKIKPANDIIPIPVPLSDSTPAYASAPASNGSRVTPQDREKDKDKMGRLSGFIFMCNGKTKPECYKFGVFGLPAGRTEEVGKIKKGTKLFLFDFDLKLLYGVYEASSIGKLNLEPAAFRGKFPAQVRFKIFKDCLPLPESSFKHAIQDNYQGSKFTPELSRWQVKNLLSLFRSFGTSASAPLPPRHPNVPPPHALPPSALEHEFNPSARLPPSEHLYLDAMQYVHAHAPPIMEPQPVQQRVFTSQHGLYGTTTTMGPVHPAMDHRGLPAPSDPHYIPGTRRTYFPDDLIQTVREPYPRYRSMQDMIYRDQLIGLESDHHSRLVLPSEREVVDHRENVVGYYDSYPMASVPYDRPLVQPYGPSSGRVGLSEVNVPISSYYSFAGATRFIR